MIFQQRQDAALVKPAKQRVQVKVFDLGKVGQGSLRSVSGRRFLGVGFWASCRTRNIRLANGGPVRKINRRCAGGTPQAHRQHDPMRLP